MNLKYAIAVALNNIKAHKLRSILTALGVIIGVALVVTIMTISIGFQYTFERTLSEYLSPEELRISTGVIVEPGAPHPTPIFRIASIAVFTTNDIDNIKKLPHVKSVYGIANVDVDRSYGLKYKNITIIPTLIGSIECYAIDFNYVKEVWIKYGRVPLRDDEIILSERLARELVTRTKGENVTEVLGEVVSVKFQDGQVKQYRAVGILRQGSLGAFLANAFYISYNSFNVTKEVPGVGRSVVFDTLVVMATSHDDVAKAKEEVLAYLRNASDAKKIIEAEYQNVDFIVVTQEITLEFVRNQINQLTFYILTLGVVSLVVGSIGVANIMLVNVTERTKEIGVMRATGAKRVDVLQLFLIESILISLIGALIGTLAGIAAAYVLTIVGPLAQLNLKIVFSVQWVTTAFAVGIVVGVISGLYPAWRAAKVNPIEALRYE